MQNLRPVVLACLLLSGAPGRALDTLQCGIAIQSHLEAGATHTYALSPNPDSVVVVNIVDRSMTPGLLRLRAPGGLETCSGSLSLAPGTATVIEVSDCIGGNETNYTITAHVVSGDSANCAKPAPCGLVPYTREWQVAGEVDAYRFRASSGDEEVVFTAGDRNSTNGTVSVQVFAPDGAPVNQPSCSGEIRFHPRASGIYTALLTPCVTSRRGRYQIGYLGAECPVGPEVSHLGLARADGLPIEPTTYDDDGRPVYPRLGGSGFFLVMEAVPGADGVFPGLLAYDYDDSDPSVLPDVQVLFSRPLGNGNADVCSEDPNHRDGIPATDPLVFAPTRAVSAAISDFGCHFDDGTGHAFGITNPVDACTTFPDGSSHFVNSISTTQFCSQIPGVRRFQEGDTIVATRVRSLFGVYGPVREMVLQVEDLPTAVPTASRTPTAVPTPTATLPPIACAGDCNHDTAVTFDEISGSVDTCLKNGAITCDSIDLDRNASISIDELVRAVQRAKAGCP